MKSKKILVLGLGPTGAIFAAHLAENGYRVYGVDPWGKHIDEIEKNGVKIKNLATIHTRLYEVGIHFEDLEETDFDYVAICVKTPYLADVVEQLKDLKGNYKLLLMQNGIDNENFVSDYFDKERILRMAVNYAGNIESLGVVKMTFFSKPNHIGCMCGKPDCRCAEEIASMMTDSGLDGEATPDIGKLTWRKLILNAILAPIAAVLGVTMADVMAEKGTRFIVESLTRECIEVAAKAGYDYGEDFFDNCINFLLKAGAHKPSMLIDLENCNPTEIDYINGKIVEYGNKFNIPVPYNTTLANLVRAKQRYNKPKKDAFKLVVT
ncbi:MAG: 2-dehydropantoate 2-reductase [bacterium]|nr:2-dehydropantoate 2-reductase [bacterium]